jgi:hypothetical protein
MQTQTGTLGVDMIDIDSFYRNKLFEWVMTCAMLGVAIEIALWPETIQASSFRYMLNLISAGNMGIFFLVFGAMRVAALIANGSWPEHGPRLRAMGAGAASLMWGQMCAALFVIIHVKGIPSPGIPVYFALTVGELVSAYRAISDARSPVR